MNIHKSIASDGTSHGCICPIGHDHTDEEFYEDERNQ